MNVCIIISNLAGGGAEKATLNLAKSFVKYGHLVQIILINDKIEHSIPNGVEIKILNKRSSFLGRGRGVLGKLVLAFFLKRIWRKSNKENKFDLTIARLPFAQEITHKAQIPAVYFVDNALSDGFQKLSLKNPKKAEKRYVKFQKILRNKVTIACSHGVMSDLKENFGGLVNSIELIHNPMDFDEIKELSINKNEHLPQVKYALHVGRYNTQKRHDILLKAWSKVLTQIDMVLILLTNSNQELSKQIESLNLSEKVIVNGFTKNPYSWMRNSEILILSSDHEGLPLVLVEAIACGTRVISTDCNYGPSEVLRNHPEFLTPIQNSDLLAKKIVWSLKQPKPDWNCDFSMFEGDTVISKYEALARRLNAIV